MSKKSFFNKDIDMTEGSIVKVIALFAIPLLLGNLFQQLYNTVDTYIVGNFVNKQAFAAVGSVGPIINTAIGFFSGFATGAGVIISQYAGAKNEQKESDTVQTSIIFTLLLCVIFTVFGTIAVPHMLRLMDTPDEVFPEANSYLKIYFLGISGLMLYNIGSGILRAVGNSVIPLVSLIISACINVVLDLLFVLVFNQGVKGVAYATVLSQVISAIFVLTVLSIKRAPYRINWTKPVFSIKIFAQIAKVGFPAAIQMAITSFSNIFVQSYINKFDTDCMAGWTAYNKIDAFAMLPMQTISLSVTTFSGQNFGAKKPERSKQGIKVGLILSWIITSALLIPIMIFSEMFVSFFNSDPNVIIFGAHFLRWISPFYLLCAINQILAGVLRGAGNSKIPMFIMLFSFVLFRQLYLFIFSRITDSIFVITFAYPAGWLVCSTLFILYYKFSHWENKIYVNLEDRK